MTEAILTEDEVNRLVMKLAEMKAKENLIFHVGEKSFKLTRFK